MHIPQLNAKESYLILYSMALKTLLALIPLHEKATSEQCMVK